VRYSALDNPQVAADVATRLRTSSTYGERLDRWAALLEKHRDCALDLLTRTEFVSASVRVSLRERRSPVSIAFADPELRAQGLAGETYGDAYEFFGLSHGTLHDIVCHCHYWSGKVTAAEVAPRVRRAAMRAQRLDGFLSAVGLRGRLPVSLNRIFV
jgi:hypothetical protein